MRAKGYFVDRAKRYAEAVISGEQIACKLVILSCKRFMRDLERQRTADFPYYYCEARAEHACQFLEYLPHIKGALASKNETLKLEPWQCFIVCNIFGWLKVSTNTRRFTKAYNEMPRKNGKTFKASGISLYCALADREAGSQVFMAASNHSQALLCFDEAKAMLAKSPDLCEYFGVEYNKLRIYVPTTESVMRALPKDQGGSLDGLNIHCAVVDELHAHQTSATWNALTMGTGSREQPLIMAITTAGFNRNSVCYEQRSYLKKILEGVYEDETYFGMIYTIDDDDDWKSPIAWAKANPNLGVSIVMDNFEADCKAAINRPSDQNHFKTKRLNMWVGADTAWIDMDKWDACADPEMKEEDCKNMELFVAVDLASVSDFCCVARVYTEKKPDETGMDANYYYLFVDHFLNETAVENQRVDEVRNWAQQDLIHVNRGDATDFRLIQNRVEELALKKPKMIGFDRYQAAQMMQELNAQKIKGVTEYPQNLANMSAPMKELEAAIVSGRLKHTGDPVLAWMFSNVVAHRDAKDHIYPNRDKTALHNKIDGAVAAIMGIGMTMRERPKENRIRFYT